MYKTTVEEFKSLNSKEKARVFESLELKKNFKRSTIYGVGINDAHFPIAMQIESRTFYHPAFTAWSNMLKRCYYNKTKYTPAVVCDEWLTFSNFLKWWHENYVEGFEIDKDIGSLLRGFQIKTYSPGSCRYIPKWENMIHRRRRDGTMFEIRTHSI